MMEMLSELIKHILNFVIMFVIIRTLVYNPVKKFMEERSARLAAERKEAENAQKDAEQLKQQYQSKMDAAEDEASQIISQSEERAKLAYDQSLVEGKQKADQLLVNARAQIDAERRSAMEQMRDEFAGLAVQIASKVLEREVTVEDNEAVIDQFFDQVG